MGKEYEAAIMDIDHDFAVKRLNELGAKFEGKHAFRRVEFIANGAVGSERHSWVRIRTDGKDTTLTFKEFLGGSNVYEPMDEYEVKTSDFEETVRIMSKLAKSELIYFENTREAYILGNLYITLDKWPEIPLFVEVEAPSETELKKACTDLAIKGNFKGNVSIEEMYKLYGLSFADVVKKNKNKVKELLKGV